MIRSSRHNALIGELIEALRDQEHTIRSLAVRCGRDGKTIRGLVERRLVKRGLVAKEVRERTAYYRISE